MVRREVDETLLKFAVSLVYVALLTFVILAALSQLGIQTTSFIAVIGAAGLAVGLALQGSLANFAAGVLMIVFRPFRVGDYIEGGGAAGVVEQISIFTTQIKTPDNKTVIVPPGVFSRHNSVLRPPPLPRGMGGMASMASCYFVSSQCPVLVPG
jgi:small conductance mechanosensitive channel